MIEYRQFFLSVCIATMTFVVSRKGCYRYSSTADESCNFINICFISYLISKKNQKNFDNILIAEQDKRTELIEV